MSRGALALALALPLLATVAGAADPARVVVVKTADAPVISELAQGFRSAFPGATLDETMMGSDDAWMAKLAGATAILSVGPRAAVAVAKAKHDAPTIACVPPSLADPATQGATMRLQPPVDGIFAAIAWMGSYKRVGFVADAAQKERLELAKVGASSRDLTLIAAPVASTREVVTAVQGLLAKVDLLVIDVTDGLSLQDVQFILKAATDANVPLVGTSEGFLKAGAPAAIAIDPRSAGAEAGRLAASRAAGLFDPRRFRVMVNLVAGARLGLSVRQDRGTVEGNVLTLDSDGTDLPRATAAVASAGNAESRPLVLRQGRLQFPAVAASTGVKSAEVILDVTIKADGKLSQTKVVRGDPLFASAAIDSLKAWEFKPGTRDGSPVEGTLRLNLKFQR